MQQVVVQKCLVMDTHVCLLLWKTQECYNVISVSFSSLLSPNTHSLTHSLTHTHTYAVVQQSSKHILCLSRPAHKQSHGGRQQLHLHSQRGFTPNSINEHLQRVGGTRHLLPINTQQPQQSLPALMQDEENEQKI